MMLAVEADVAVDGSHHHASLTGVPVDAWHGGLTALATVATYDEPAAAADLDLPHELLLGSGVALRLGRQDLLAELVARHQHQVTGGPAAEQVRLLHGAGRGRLQVVVAGPRRRAGWVSWVLQPDGWRRLTPHVTGGVAMVRVTAARPRELGVDVARLVTAVR